MYFTYALVNQAGKIYIGQTKNLEQRLAHHNGLLPTKKKSYTYKQGIAWQVLHQETFSTRTEAMVREKQLKSARGRLFLKNLLNSPSAVG